MNEKSAENRSAPHSACAGATSSSTSARPANSKKKLPTPSNSSASRHHKARPVIYKSSNLTRAAPDLVAQTTPETVSAVRAIQHANAVAERVRENYRQNKNPSDLGTTIEGNDDESNAKKYERRLKMNRQSAAASRVRREAYTKALEAEIVKMERDYIKVVRALRQERAERNRLTRLFQGSMQTDDSDVDDLPDIIPDFDQPSDHNSSSQPSASTSAPAVVMEPPDNQPPAISSKQLNSGSLANSLPFPHVSAPEITVGPSAPLSTSAPGAITLPLVINAQSPRSPALRTQLEAPSVPVVVPIDFNSLADTSLDAVLAAGSVYDGNAATASTATAIAASSTGNPDHFMDPVQSTSPIDTPIEKNQDIINDMTLARELRLSSEAIDSLGARGDSPLPTCFMTPEDMAGMDFFAQSLFD